jgi:phosphotransferase system HPr (HPr) family protein
MVEAHSANQGNGHVRRTVVVRNPQGLHMRPAMAFAQAAQKFASTVTVLNGDQSGNGKSLIDLMTLAAEQGTELILEIHGADAQSALPVLTEILSAPSADDFEGEGI